MTASELPIAVIGAGPVGLAAAAHLLGRGMTPVVLESGPSAGTSLSAWGHVQVFSPWRYVIDAASRDLLLASGWNEPDPDALPLGAEIVEHYLAPLSRVPILARHIHYNATVTAISRLGLEKVANTGREAAPFNIRYQDAEGREQLLTARAVLDASGTWARPNPIGVDGLPAPGERAALDRIAYGIPNVGDAACEDYRNRHVLVIGGGHSAINVVLALLELRKSAPGTTITWALRRNRVDGLLGGGLNDQLPARGALGIAARAAIRSGNLRLLAPFAAEAIARSGKGLVIDAIVGGRHETITADRIVVATGFRPDLAMLSELRLDLDSAVEAPRQLAPLIDPNFHSCGTVPPHGVVELAQPEANFYIVGSKAYGRAPTFLMATGYEQVRSVTAELAGAHEAAREVRLVLPETGVCSAPHAEEADGAGGCCGGPAPAGTDACCIADAEAKITGQPGCGCTSAPGTVSVEPAE